MSKLKTQVVTLLFYGFFGVLGVSVRPPIQA